MTNDTSPPGLKLPIYPDPSWSPEAVRARRAELREGGVADRLRELYERVTGDGDKFLVGYARIAQWLGAMGFQPGLVGKGGVLASRWTVARWLKAWRVPVLWWNVDRHEGQRLGLAPGRYPCITRYALLGAIFEVAKWPLPRGRGMDGSQATIPAPTRPLPPAAGRFSREGWRRHGRPGRAA